MTNTELNTRIANYKQALTDGRITGKEYQGFMQALREMATVSFKSAGAKRKGR